MTKILAENEQDSIQAYSENETAGLKLGESLAPLEAICEDINRILYPNSERPMVKSDQPPVSGLESEPKVHIMESDSQRKSTDLEGRNQEKRNPKFSSSLLSSAKLSSPQTYDVKMEEKNIDADAASNGSSEKEVDGVIVLDD